MDSRSHESREAVPTMTNNNNNKKNNNNNNSAKRGNPISYNPKLTYMSPGIPRTLHGKDIIKDNVLTADPSAYKSEDVPINPRLSTSFPSASLTAARYDQYTFEELIFRYVPTTAVTTSPGVIFLAWEPNANRGAPQSISEINAYEFHVQGPLYSPNLELRVPKMHLPPPRYCRKGPTGSDLNFYDTGRLIVVTDDGETGTARGGYIEVRYKLRFFHYHLEETLVRQNRVAEFRASATSMTTNVEATMPFSPSDGETFGLTGAIVAGSNPGQWILPIGKYLIHLLLNSVSNGTTSLQCETALLKDGVYELTSSGSTSEANTHSTHLTGLIESTGKEVWEITHKIISAGVLLANEMNWIVHALS